VELAKRLVAPRSPLGENPMLEQSGPDFERVSGYCVSSSNSIPEYVPIENYNALRETVLRYGNYPISV